MQRVSGATDRQPFVELDGLRKQFAGRDVLRDFSLTVGAGEIVALLGVSGSGKTTALRLLAGLDAADAGTIKIDGEDVTRQKAARRGVGMVFQHYALFPHLSIGENVSFGLEGRGLERAEIRARAEAALAQVQLAGRFDGRVGALSGGMQQRVAIARALAPAPRVLLLDEPFSNLDPVLREQTRAELRDTIRRIGITTVLVTHEQEEAFDVADRIALLVEGRLQQIGTAEDLYARPRTLAAARFIGRSSELAGVAIAHGESWGLRLAIDPQTVWPARPNDGAVPIADGRTAVLVVRPEALRFVERGAEGIGRGLAGVVIARRFAGPWSYFRIRLERGGEVEVLARSGAVEADQPVTVALDAAAPPPTLFAAEPA
jgi:putative spermidine/putrescine transport system ATP-binding protein